MRAPQVIWLVRFFRVKSIGGSIEDKYVVLHIYFRDQNVFKSVVWNISNRYSCICSEICFCGNVFLVISAVFEAVHFFFRSFSLSRIGFS